MSVVPVIVTVAMLAGLVLAVRLAGERAARHAADARVAELNTRVAALNARVAELAAAGAPGRGEQIPPDHQLGSDGTEREWLAVLAHELRSPVGAILGYAELLDDGTVGDVDERGQDAVLRIANAAEQILRLVEGLENIARAEQDAGQPEDVRTEHLIRNAADAMRLEAEVRDARITVDDGDWVVRTKADATERALLLALGAALKASHGRDIRIGARPDDGNAITITIGGTGLRHDADDPDNATTPMTGAGLRIALARRALAPTGGSVWLRAAADGTDLLLTLPDAGAEGGKVLAAAEQDP